MISFFGSRARISLTCVLVVNKFRRHHIVICRHPSSSRERGVRPLLSPNRVVLS